MLIVFDGHFVTGLGSPPPSWTASTSFTGGNTLCQPSPATGYYFRAAGSGGTSGTVQPTWLTIVGAETLADNTISGWICEGTLLGFQLAYWDQIQCQTVNGDLGGTWSPQDPLTFLTGNGGVVLVEGPTQVTNDAILQITSSAKLSLGALDFPRNSPTHLGRTRILATSCMGGLSDSVIGVRQDFAVNALTAIACALTYYTPSSDDVSVKITTKPVQWQVPLNVHNTGTAGTVTITYRANLGTPKARVIAVSSAGAVFPLTSAAQGADASGYVTASAVVVTDTVQSWVLPIDGGAVPANAVMARDTYTYLLQIVEDATETEYPGTLPVLGQVFVTTTVPIDLANAPSTIDGLPVLVGARVLVKNQFNPEENGVYLYPGAGKQFPLAAGTPVPVWQAGTAYATGALVQPVGASPGHGFYFKCTTAGTSSTTTQPTWPLVTGATVADGAGALIWTCQGELPIYAYNPVVELRTFGLQQGAIVYVQSGVTSIDTWWQYTGPSVDPSSLGYAPALGWYPVQAGLIPATTTDVSQDAMGAFAAQGNAYHAAVCDFTGIATQEFQ